MHINIDILATCTVAFLLLPRSTLMESLENINRCMAQHSCLALPHDPNQDIWSYYKLLLINPIVFDKSFDYFPSAFG